MHTKKILVVGGAGFIGSHMLHLLRQEGFSTIVLDNLVHGHAHAVSHSELIIGNLGNSSLLKSIFSSHDISAVMHFASLINVHDSIHAPGRYYHNNVVETLQLLETMCAFAIPHLIFSSSASVYGAPLYTPIDEEHPLQPMTPYGRSKRMVEEIIEDYAKKHDFTYAILRYFNASGAAPEASLGERHIPETHLIPKALRVAKGEEKNLTMFGEDYETHDGSCIRDYVHVKDICRAHLLVLSQLYQKKPSMVYNLGQGQGHSVMEVIKLAEKLTRAQIPLEIAPRRRGDPAILVADATKIKNELGFRPTHDLEQIVQDTWAYMQMIY